MKILLEALDKETFDDGIEQVTIERYALDIEFMPNEDVYQVERSNLYGFLTLTIEYEGESLLMDFADENTMENVESLRCVAGTTVLQVPTPYFRIDEEMSTFRDMIHLVSYTVTYEVEIQEVSDLDFEDFRLDQLEREANAS